MAVRRSAQKQSAREFGMSSVGRRRREESERDSTGTHPEIRRAKVTSASHGHRCSLSDIHSILLCSTTTLVLSTLSSTPFRRALCYIEGQMLTGGMLNARHVPLLCRSPHTSLAHWTGQSSMMPLYSSFPILTRILLGRSPIGMNKPDMLGPGTMQVFP